MNHFVFCITSWELSDVEFDLVILFVHMLLSYFCTLSGRPGGYPNDDSTKYEGKKLN